jgi:hypothetical protein
MERKLFGIGYKSQVGKDTVGKMIQWMTSNDFHMSFESFCLMEQRWFNGNDYVIKKFADKLKDIVCLLTGCTRKQLESEDFKNSSLPNEWKQDESSNKAVSFRYLMQKLGTDLLRNQLHQNIWVNATFADYNDFPWCITDVRFKNEADIIKDKGGILIKINRDLPETDKSHHESEKALDNYTGWDYIITNNGSFKDLAEEVKKILIKEGIIHE